MIPTVSATATMPFTRPLIIFELNSGASRNIGETRARTRKKAATCCSEKWARRVSGAIFATDGLEVDLLGDAAPQVRRPVGDRVEHPRTGDDQHDHEGDDLRDEGERLLLDLGDGLEDRDQQADDQGGQEHRHGDLDGDGHHVDHQAGDGILGHVWKLWTRDPQIRFQPSTRMNRRILNGSEMKTGGSIIIPIDINVDETTRSMIRNGRKIRKPIWKAVLSSEMMNAGISTWVGTSRRVLTSEGFSPDSFTNRATSLSRVWLNMNSRS